MHATSNKPLYPLIYPYRDSHALCSCFYLQRSPGQNVCGGRTVNQFIPGAKHLVYNSKSSNTLEGVPRSQSNQTAHIYKPQTPPIGTYRQPILYCTDECLSLRDKVTLYTSQFHNSTSSSKTFLSL